ncbi:hypothetical protein [Devosia sp. Naph2]|uniref:hypothetical protein n=1 Tax=Devosia polycyclovorans TaxID=3345148 RepID=UPI0035CEB57B
MNDKTERKEFFDWWTGSGRSASYDILAEQAACTAWLERASRTSPEPGEWQVEAILSWVREDVLPAYGITHDTRLSDPEMLEGAHAARRAASIPTQPGVRVEAVGYVSQKGLDYLMSGQINGAASVEPIKTRTATIPLYTSLPTAALTKAGE